MANSPLSPLTGGNKPSFIALLISICVLSSPILPLSDNPNSYFPLPEPILRDLTFATATVTFFLGIGHLILHVSKPSTVSATHERFSMVTLCAACVTLILGLLLVLKVAILDALAVCAGGGRGGGEGQIGDIMNLFMQNRKFGR